MYSIQLLPSPDLNCNFFPYFHPLLSLSLSFALRSSIHSCPLRVLNSLLSEVASASVTSGQSKERKLFSPLTKQTLITSLKKSNSIFLFLFLFLSFSFAFSDYIHYKMRHILDHKSNVWFRVAKHTHTHTHITYKLTHSLSLSLP